MEMSNYFRERNAKLWAADEYRTSFIDKLIEKYSNCDDSPEILMRTLQVVKDGKLPMKTEFGSLTKHYHNKDAQELIQETTRYIKEGRKRAKANEELSDDERKSIPAPKPDYIYKIDTTNTNQKRLILAKSLKTIDNSKFNASMDVQQAGDNLSPNLNKNSSTHPSENKKKSVGTKKSKEVCNLITAENNFIIHGCPSKKNCGNNKSLSHQNGYSSKTFSKKHKPGTLDLKNNKADNGNNEALNPYQNILQRKEKNVLKAVSANSTAKNPFVLNTHSTIYPPENKENEDSVMVKKGKEISNFITCEEAITTSVSSGKKANRSPSPRDKSYFQTPKRNSSKKTGVLKNPLENYSVDTVFSISMRSPKKVMENYSDNTILSVSRRSPVKVMEKSDKDATPSEKYMKGLFGDVSIDTSLNVSMASSRDDNEKTFELPTPNKMKDKSLLKNTKGTDYSSTPKSINKGMRTKKPSSLTVNESHNMSSREEKLEKIKLSQRYSMELLNEKTLPGSKKSPFKGACKDLELSNSKKKSWKNSNKAKIFSPSKASLGEYTEETEKSFFLPKKKRVQDKIFKSKKKPGTKEQALLRDSSEENTFSLESVHKNSRSMIILGKEGILCKDRSVSFSEDIHHKNDKSSRSINISNATHTSKTTFATLDKDLLVQNSKSDETIMLFSKEIWEYCCKIEKKAYKKIRSESKVLKYTLPKCI